MDNHTKHAPRGRRWGGALVGLAVALVTLVLTWAAPLAFAEGTGQHREIHVTMRQWGYEPGIITVNRGDTVTLHLKSVDVLHGIYIDGYDLQQLVYPEEDQTLTFVADRPGRWMFRCSHTCGSFHPYMTGWLRVQPNQFNIGGSALALAAGLGFLGFLGWEAWRA